MKTVFMILIALIIALIIASCSGHKAWLIKDAWCRYPPKSLGFSQSNEIAAYQVNKSQEKQSIKRLSVVEFVSISPEEAKKLSAVSIPEKSLGSFYLIRGVKLDPRAKVSVLKNGDSFLVHHSNLGRGPRTMLKTVVMIHSLNKPINIYSVCSMA